MKENPMNLFKLWYKEEQLLSEARIFSACCLSTIGLDGFPNARFLSLKDVSDKGFIITGTQTARKGQEINVCKNVALTFWWAETEKQVRIQGKATIIADALADKYFLERNRDSQIVSIVSNQGSEVESMQKLLDDYEHIEATLKSKILKRPKNWGGYEIEPIRMEFLAFKQTRFHSRVLFQLLENENWSMIPLQP